jgi:hypothetical protein
MVCVRKFISKGNLSKLIDLNLKSNNIGNKGAKAIGTGKLSKLNTRPIDEKTKIDLSWRLLNSSAKYAPATACVKHYLSNHIRTRFLKINFSDWITASMLPVENFKKAKKDKVWKDTKQKYGY